MYAKPEMEFFDSEKMVWQPIPGHEGVFEKVLSRDEGTGDYTRLVYRQPRLDQAPMEPLPLAAGYCREVFLWKGGAVEPKAGKAYGEWYYGCFYAGEEAPLLYPDGCVSVEHVYRDPQRSKPTIHYTDSRLIPWTPVAGTRCGAVEKMLSVTAGGDHCRLIYSPIDLFGAIADLRNPPAKVLEHDHWEEVFIARGSILDTRNDDSYAAGYYACRPPHMPHGPLYHPDGCVSLEWHYNP